MIRDTVLRVARRYVAEANASVGLFLPLPKVLAQQFPSLAPEDDSPPHVTLLYVGPVPSARKDAFLTVVRAALSQQPGPITATLGAPDVFVHPDKDRRVWHSRVQFSKDVAGIRDRVRSALMDAGFEVLHSFPLAFFPHVTLAYVPDASSTKLWDGPVPEGTWTFDDVAVWGFGKSEVRVPLGTYGQARTGAAKVDALALYRALLDTYQNKRTPRWEPFPFMGVDVEVIHPDPRAGFAESLRVRFPGSSDAYAWSPRTKTWKKSRRRPPQEEAEPVSQPMSEEERAFYGQAPDEMLRVLRSYPKSALHLLGLRRELLPAEVLAFLADANFVFPNGRHAKDRIPGGLGDGKTPSEFDPKALAKGVRVELEHTSDAGIAREIAMDHLMEDLKYYDKLESIEKHGRLLTQAARELDQMVQVMTRLP